MLSNHPQRDTATLPTTGHRAQSTTMVNRFSHILVPTSMGDDHCPALLFAVEMAMVYQAKLTVLHVHPPIAHEPTIHWLDGIERLYQSVDKVDNGQVLQVLDVMKATREKVKQFCVRALPANILDEVTIQAECRTGDTAETIVRYANDQGVDLVVMSGGRSRRIPLLPSIVRYVMQHAKQEVLLTGPRRKTRAK